jgi:hypothetical protein
MLVGDSGLITGNSQVSLHSRAMLAEMFLQTALGAMIQFHLPGKSHYRTSSGVMVRDLSRCHLFQYAKNTRRSRYSQPRMSVYKS